jgi:hypothetical protein
MAYLFVHFIGEEPSGEQIYFSLSKDGLHWSDLNHGKPTLITEIGTRGVRDPFPVRDPRTGKVYIIGTDLCIGSGTNWGDAVTRGSRDILVWSTEDLIHWEGPKAHTVGISEAGCVWAPEAVYDAKKEEFFIFFASHVKYTEDAEPKHRIYSVTTKDFETFTDARLYIERENHIIDTTILEDHGTYYRISKNETVKRLDFESAESLEGPFVPLPSVTFENLYGVEGPEGYLLPDGETWCVIADQFATGKGYLPMLTKDLASGDFRILSPEEYDLGRTKKRHGGILTITEEECRRMADFYGIDP